MKKLGRVVVILVAIFVVIVVVGRVAGRPPEPARVVSQSPEVGSAAARTTEPAPTATRAAEPVFTATLMRPDQRVGDYAGLTVNFVNPTKADVSNPQIRTTVSLNGRDWTCQGYEDPTSGKPVTDTGTIITQPLVIPAGKTMPVTILCKMPPAPMEDAQIRFH